MPDPWRCRDCGSDATVTDTRPLPEYRRRRYECSQCGRRWTTYETVANPLQIPRDELLDAVVDADDPPPR